MGDWETIATPEDLLAKFTRGRWEKFELRQKRIAIGAVLQTVIVKPLPKGRATRAPFDPTLLEIVYQPTS